MKKNKILIIAGIILCIFAIIGSSYAFGFFTQTTDFDNQFMSGSFVGDVSQNKIDKNVSYYKWTDSYENKEKNITYNMSCVKEGSFMTDLYQLQGMKAPEVRKFNDMPWKIYYSQAVPTPAENETINESASNDTINVYICEADVNDTAYMINVIAYDNKVECDGSLYCKLFKEDIQPLLESVELKDSSKAPHMYTILNVTKSEFNDLKDYLEQVKAGNITADGSQQQ